MKHIVDSKEKIGIVADDLTSAADGASVFLARGYAPRIFRRGYPGAGDAVVSIDTGSRLHDEAQAAYVTRRATTAVAKRPLLYKTIDSTLRGHIRAEIAAAFRASGRRRLVIAPAFPAAGRTTVDGVQLLHGVPVAQTAYGRDPVHPARMSTVRDLVDPALGKPVLVPAGLDDGEMARSIEGASVIILDATSQAMLNHRVARIAAQGPALWVGSPGMAEALASIVSPAPAASMPPVKTSGGVLVLAGSANPVTHEQCDMLAATGVSVAGHAAAIDTQATVACLRAPPNREDDAAAVLASLVDEALAALSRRHYGAILATGGETMDALMKRLSISSFTLIREIEPGLPLGQAHFPGGRSLLLAMKAGGFGAATTLRDAADIILNIGKERS